MTDGRTSGSPSALDTHSRILLDKPASELALGYGDIADRFAHVIETSAPGFALGLFGDRGSGKTTLMQAVRMRLKPEAAIPVDFDVWRFERERELLIPLLDTIRQALIEWARAQRSGADRAREAARRIGRVVRALLSGASVELELMPKTKVSYDVSTALEGLRAGDEDGTEPQSLYVAGFRELKEALDEAIEGGVPRIVVFVDDLDRCLPTAALEVLEAMKLFFDLKGFVFVVGLDGEIVEGAVRIKFWSLFASQLVATAIAPGAAEPDLRAATEHIENLFQVRYDLPPVLDDQLDELLTAMFREAEVEQPDELASGLRPYLQCASRGGSINPREVKRFINAFTLETLARPQLDPHVVLSILTIKYRPDWQVAYALMRAHPTLFAKAVGACQNGDYQALQSVWPRNDVVPVEFAEFAASPLAKPLVEARRLETYLPSVRSMRRMSASLDIDAELDAINELVGEINDLDNLENKYTTSRLASDIAERAVRIATQVLCIRLDAEWLQPVMTATKLLEKQATRLSGADAEPQEVSSELAETVNDLDLALDRVRAALRRTIW
jgi:hypothetical protein